MDLKKIMMFLICGLTLFLLICNTASAQEDEMFYGTGLIVCILLAMIIPIILAIVIGIWMYRDANSRGMSGVLWLVIMVIATFAVSFIGFIVVLIIYLVVRRDHPVGSYPHPLGIFGPPPGYYPPPGYPPPGYPPPGYPPPGY